MSIDMNRVARQTLRALRGKRSQAALSKRLGFSSNVAAKWESGQRMPTAAEVFHFSERLGVNMEQVLTRFQPNVGCPRNATRQVDLSAWLSALRGSQQLTEIAQKSSLSRFSVGRFLAGHSQPRLPQFLALVDALTQRVDELINLWVGIDNVPLLGSRFSRVQAAREAMLTRPVCLAIMCLLDTQRFQSWSSKRQIAELAESLELSLEDVKECLGLLADGGVLHEMDGGYQLIGSLTVDAHASRKGALSAQAHWAGVAQARAASPKAEDVCSYNVFSIAHADFLKLKELQRDFYRGARALIAASEPTDMAALMMVQLVTWQPGSEPLTPGETSQGNRKG